MTKKASIRATVLAFSLALPCLLPSAARAGIISIDDLTDSLLLNDTTGRLIATSCVGEVCTFSFLAPKT
jgi:hypothetical protein